MKPSRRLSFVAAFAVSLLASTFSVPSVQSAVIFQYSGGGDPTLQGWSEDAGSGSGTSAGTVGAESAWSVDDTSLAAGSNRTYFGAPTAGEHADGAANGWTLSATLKTVTGNASGFNTIFLDYIDGATQWLLFFGIAPDGDPFVGAQTSSGPLGVFEVDGGAGTYHDYSLVYDPIAGSADLFVDGIERISDYTETPVAFSRVAWGAGADNGTGEANFQSVTFETDSVAVSEPGALIVFAAGLAGLGVLRRRARRFP